RTSCRNSSSSPSSAHLRKAAVADRPPAPSRWAMCWRQAYPSASEYLRLSTLPPAPAANRESTRLLACIKDGLPLRLPSAHEDALPRLRGSPPNQTKSHRLLVYSLPQLPCRESIPTPA